MNEDTQIFKLLVPTKSQELVPITIYEKECIYTVSIFDTYLWNHQEESLRHFNCIDDILLYMKDEFRLESISFS